MIPINQIKRKYIRILKDHLLLCALSASLLITVSCADDNHITVPGTTTTPGMEVPVRLTIHTPGNSTQKSTRNQTEQETRITEIQVLVFEGGNYKYSVAGDIVRYTQSTTTFDAVLKSSAQELKLYIVANVNNLFQTPFIAENSSEADVKMSVIKQFPFINTADKLPMFGEYTLPNGLTAGNSSDIVGVKMLRSVARVDLAKEDTITNFDLVSVQLFRVSDKIQIIPNQLLAGNDPKVENPSIPAGTTITNTAEVPVTNGTNISSIYLPESVGYANDDTGNNTVCLVIGGKFNNNPVSYYRIDFRTKDFTGHVLRNHRYLFNIQEVKGEGWPTAQDAADNPSSDITTILEKWEDNQTNEITDGTYFLGFSSQKVLLNFRAGSAGYLDIRTNLNEYTLQWVSADGTPLPGAIASETIENETFKAQVVNKSTEDGVNFSQIRISAIKNNRTNDMVTGYMNINAGRWKVRVEIGQVSSKDYGDVIVRILSLGTSYGSLGGSYPGGTGGTATAMKPILLNHDNFGPDGTVPVGFIGMDNVSGSYTAEELRNILEMFDIVNVVYSSNPSTDESKAITDWLKAHPNRVLLVTRDNTSTNTNLLTELGVTAGMWSGGGTGDDRFFELPSLTADNDYFLASGPFAPVNPFSIRAYNGTWLTILPGSELGQRVTPLLVSQDGDRGYALAVDKENRVVYCGHSRLYWANAFALNNSGLTDYDAAKLFANVYAWAIEEIVMPGKIKDR